MGSHAKLIAAFGVSIVGIAVTYGLVDEAQAKAIGLMITQAAALIALWAVPNSK